MCRRVGVCAVVVLLVTMVAGCRNRYGVEGFVDGVVAESNTIRFNGWVHLPDGVRADAVRLELVVDGAIVENWEHDASWFVGVRRQPRPDVDGAVPGVNIGYEARFAHMVGWGGVRAACLAVVPAWAPPSTALRADTWVACPRIPELRTMATIDVIEVSGGIATVTGWSFTPGNSRTPVREFVYTFLDGVRVHPLPSSPPSDGDGPAVPSIREDVEAALHVAAWELELSIAVDPGEHELCLGATRDLDPRRVEDARVLSCRRFTA